MKQYVMGVDGGNTKTDYFLFDTDGHLIDYQRCGTCSHERFANGYEGSYQAMKEAIEPMLSKHGLKASDLVGAAFGLAGVDILKQRLELEEVARRLGFQHFVVDNDSFLGIKAALPKGYGVCSINGTGTVAGGIAPNGNRLQVGGIGDVSGDEAGGAFIARKVLRAVYDELYRCGTETMMTEKVMTELKVSDKSLYIEAISELYSHRFSHTPFVQIVLDCAEAGDEVAISLLDHVAMQLANSAAGCVNHLPFTGEVEVVLAGSVWVKPTFPILRQRFVEYMNQLANQSVKVMLLSLPPATGAVLWALELAHHKPVEGLIRQRVIEQIETLGL